MMEDEGRRPDCRRRVVGWTDVVRRLPLQRVKDILFRVRCVWLSVSKANEVWCSLDPNVNVVIYLSL